MCHVFGVCPCSCSPSCPVYHLFHHLLWETCQTIIGWIWIRCKQSPFIWELLYSWVGFGSYVCLLTRKDVNCCWFENFSHGCLVCLDTLVWHRAGTRLGMAFLCKHRNTEIHECQYRYAEVPSILRGDIYVNICSLSRQDGGGIFCFLKLEGV